MLLLTARRDRSATWSAKGHRTPGVAHVGGPLLVPGSVRCVDGDEVVTLVEAARPRVGLEGPQPQAVRSQPLRLLKELRANPTAAPGRVDVQLVDIGISQDQEPNDVGTDVIDSNPQLPFHDHNRPKVVAYIVVGMHGCRYGRYRGLPRAQPNLGRRERVSRGPPPNNRVGTHSHHDREPSALDAGTPHAGRCSTRHRSLTRHSEQTTAVYRRGRLP